MGYEFETASGDEVLSHQARQRLMELERRWQPACDSLAAALAELRALADTPTDAGRVLAARERVARARRTRLALAEEIERIESEAYLQDIWR